MGSGGGGEKNSSPDNKTKGEKKGEANIKDEAPFGVKSQGRGINWEKNMILR